MEGPTLTVVIPTYNSADLALRCLASLERQTAHPALFEVVVVDDGSRDDTAARLRLHLAKSRLNLRLCFPAHGGPAAARNHGARQARADWVAFLDADMVAGEDWVERALELIAGRPDAGGFEGRTEVGGMEGVTPFTHQMLNRTGGRYPTCNLVVRRELARFHPGYPQPFREDTDLAFSILEAGYEIPFAPGLLAFHPPLDPKLQRPLDHAMRYYYDGLLERRFPERYRRDVDVHVVLGVRLPHLRRRAYTAFVAVQAAFFAALAALPGAMALLEALAAAHLATYLAVIAIQVRPADPRRLSARDLPPLLLLGYVVPWVLVAQRWRGKWRYRAEPRFDLEAWRAEVAQAAARRPAPAKVIPMRPPLKPAAPPASHAQAR